MRDPAIEIIELTRSFGAREALLSVTPTLPRGIHGVWSDAIVDRLDTRRALPRTPDLANVPAH
jgi:hypothetical protein